MWDRGIEGVELRVSVWEKWIISKAWTWNEPYDKVKFSVPLIYRRLCKYAKICWIRKNTARTVTYTRTVVVTIATTAAATTITVTHWLFATVTQTTGTNENRVRSTQTYSSMYACTLCAAAIASCAQIFKVTSSSAITLADPHKIKFMNSPMIELNHFSMLSAVCSRTVQKR